MILWEIITDNSSLPVHPGNNLWMHLNSQQSGSGQNILAGGFGLEININKTSMTLINKRQSLAIKMAETTLIIEPESSSTTTTIEEIKI